MATTLESIEAKIQKLRAKADAIAAKQSAAVIAHIRELMDKHGLTVADLDVTPKRKTAVKTASTGRAPSASTKGAGVVKYRDPETGATWSGMGRRPAWIKDAGDPERFLVGAASSSVMRAEGAVKSKHRESKLKGTHVAPKYRDPRTGATWTGRGLAPAWIKNVKNRSKFAIGESAATVTSRAVVASGSTAAKGRAAGTTSKRGTAPKTAPKRPAAKRRVASRSVGRGRRAAQVPQMDTATAGDTSATAVAE